MRPPRRLLASPRQTHVGCARTTRRDGDDQRTMRIVFRIPERMHRTPDGRHIHHGQAQRKCRDSDPPIAVTMADGRCKIHLGHLALGSGRRTRCPARFRKSDQFLKNSGRETAEHRPPAGILPRAASGYFSWVAGVQSGAEPLHLPGRVTPISLLFHRDFIAGSRRFHLRTLRLSGAAPARVPQTPGVAQAPEYMSAQPRSAR